MRDGERSITTVSTVKIVRPKISGIAPRQRLFRLLDNGIKRPVTWVYGPGGSGKTTLVASWLDSRKLPCLWYQVDDSDADIASFFYYMGLAAKKAAPRRKKPLPLLTPEYMMGVSTFTRRYFENLFRRLKTPCVLVLDNFQEAPSPAFHHIISCAMETIPEGISVIGLSRAEPPQELARLRANNGISFVGWSDLSFTLRECRDLLKGKSLPEELVRQLRDRTDGWAAGLVLMTEKRTEAERVACPLISELSNEDVFGYFASEILDKTDPSTCEFLLKTSFLPSMTAVAAEKLTGNAKSGNILSMLTRSHYFTDRRSLSKPVFQYHPLFREFLLSRARTVFTPEELTDLQLRAATIVEAEERIEEAAALYIEAEAWSDLGHLILTNAQSLIPQGRGQTLEAWIRTVPQAIMDSVPWLHYWLGICRLPFDPAGSRRLFERAFQVLDTQKDDTGMLLCWSATITSIFHEWDEFRKLDPLIAWLQNRISQNKPFPSPLVEAVVSNAMVMALLWRRGLPSEFSAWNERALRLTLTAGDINLRLQACHSAVQFYILSGDFAKARIVNEELARASKSAGVSPMMKALCNAMEPSIDVMSMDRAGSFRSVAECLQATDEIGIHIWDHMLYAQGVCYSLNTGDIRAGGDLLEKMKESLAGPKCFGLFHYHMLAAWYSLLRDETSAALAHAEAGLTFIEMSGAFLPEAEFQSHFVIAQIADEQKDYRKADKQLSVARGLAEKTESGILRYMILMTEAQFRFDRGEQNKGLEFLRRAMELGRSRGYLSMFWWWRPDVMARLCRHALDEGIEEEYVKQLIVKRRLVPDPSFSSTENWPYPIKIYTLGSFRVLRDERPLGFSGKVQQKPLALLKAIIALGSKGVAQEQLIDALWPDAEGDNARKSLEVTLYRLRSLLGTDDAVQLRSGRITLDARYCWVDVHDLEMILEKALESWKLAGKDTSGRSAADAVRFTEKTMSLYRGHFLPGEVEMHWTAGMRERTRSKVLSLIALSAEAFERQGLLNTAVHYYLEGLEIDRLAEKFYQHLMLCYHGLGRKSEAVRVYRQCCNALSSGLGITPSEKTETIHRRIRG